MLNKASTLCIFYSLSRTERGLFDEYADQGTS